jgi:hypothetical protein
MKKLLLLATAAVALTGCATTTSLSMVPEQNPTVPMSDFIIGTWNAETTDLRSGEVVPLRIQLEFTGAGYLFVDLESDISAYNIPLRYRLLGEDRLAIEGRIGDEWTLAKTQGKLLVTGSYWPTEGPVSYERGVSPNWPLVASVIAVVAVLTIFIRPPRLGTKQPMREHSWLLRIRGTPRKIVFAMALLACFATGILTALEMQSCPPVLRIRAPWTSVLRLEIGALGVIAAGRLLLSLRRASAPFFTQRTAPLPYLGAFLLGIGAPLLLVGLLGVCAYLLIGP